MSDRSRRRSKKSHNKDRQVTIKSSSDTSLSSSAEHRTEMTERYEQEGSSTSLINSREYEKNFDLLANTSTSIETISSTLIEFISRNGHSIGDWANHHVAFTGFNAVEMRRKVATTLNPAQVILLLIVGLVRGNNVTRITSSMRSADTKRKFQDAVRALKVRDRVQGDYTAVTLSRIIACFPEVVCRILHQAEVPMAVAIETLKKVYAEFPSCARHQACAGVIPATLSDSDVHKALDVIMVPFMMISELINSKNTNWRSQDNVTKAETSSSYLLNSYNSQVLSDSDRVVHAKALSIIIDEKRLTTVWEAAAVHSKAWLQKKYSFSFQG